MDGTPGPRDHLITQRLAGDLSRLDPEMIVEEALDPAEGPSRLARHAMHEIERELSADESAEDQTARLNRILGQFGSDENGSETAQVALPPRVLLGIKARSPLGDPLPLPPSPATPFSQSDLLVNAEGQPNIGSELKAELATADSVDLICAFVIWTGVRHLRESIADVVRRGGRVRVITTTYMGTTEKRAVDELFALGARIRVALDARTTKLHAKAWLLERASRTDHCVRRLLQPLAHGAVRRPGVERAAVINGRGARDRPGADDVREPLGVGALRATTTRP